MERKEKAISSKNQEQEPSGLLASGIARIIIESEGGGQIYAVITQEYCDCGENVQIRVTPEPLAEWR